MSKSLVVLLVVGLVAACGGAAYALAMEYPKGQPITSCNNWPAGLRELLDNGNRVYGYFVNTVDTHYYTGDAEAFNAFLERYSDVDLPNHTLIIHSGKGSTRGMGGREGAKAFDYDWSVRIDSGWLPAGAQTADHPPIVTIDLYVGGNVKRDKVVVPKNVNDYGMGVKATKGKQPAFAIYLLADEKTTFRELNRVGGPKGAAKPKLGELALQDKPLFTIDDFVSYDWKDQALTLKPELIGRIPQVRNVFGVPFVAVAGGKRIYVGGFWTSISSYLPQAPVIYADEWRRGIGGSNVLKIELPFKPDTGGDPRMDPAIKAAFQKAGKLI